MILTRLTLIAACLFAAASAHALDFEVQTIRPANCGDICPKIIVAQGDILEDDDERLARLFEKTADLRHFSRVLMINSPGGHSAGGYKLAQIARRLKLTVVVATPVDAYNFAPGICNSACTFVLSGGVRRVVTPGSIVAVHWGKQLPEVTGSIPARSRVPRIDDAQAAAEYKAFFRSMGVSTKIVDIMRRTPFEEARVLSARELRSLRLVNARQI